MPKILPDGELERALLQAVQEHPRITILENHFAVELTDGSSTKTGIPEKK